MDRLHLDHYAAALRAREAELAAALKDRQGIEVDSQPDLFDEVQTAMDRSLIISNLDRSSAQLRDVQDAFARIADGSYGECVNCQEEISPKRLAALPWASLCLRCQELADTSRDAEPRFEVAA